MGGSIKLEGKVARDAEAMLADVTRLLGKIGIRYGLDGGTLLGIVREDRLLPWDDDMDLVVTEDQLPRLEAKLYRFRLAGYKVSVKRARSAMGVIPAGAVRLIKIRSRKYLFWRGDLLMDLFIKYASGDRYEWIVGEKNAVHKSVDGRFYRSFGKLSFRGVEYTVPAETEAYLGARYGEWRTPVKVWDFRRDDQAISQGSPSPS